MLTHIMTLSRPAMRSRTLSWPAALFGAAVLLGGCVGERRTFQATRPIVLEHRAMARTPVQPAAATASPTLSREQKERLFQSFRRSQDQKGRTATTQGEQEP